ncbi:uncharacterized protein LOC109795571 [Cajanus cajan]|uniref:uncharacterized protein LOC109795571 n=1 Tax=Cajanus cajan TaxID=3821 RepID=UPI00098D76B4|nr:uncharacterized protein LOC109795571 [Cajanus cajan]
MEVPLPPTWKPLNIDRYDGTTDPNEHINAYVTQINLYTNDDTIMCRVFPTSLKGATLSWYTQLPPRSVDSFNTLVHFFSDQYATSRPHHITSTALSNLLQQDDESLRHFMEHFANVSIKIRNLNPEVALHSMLMALKPRPFVDSLCRHQPASMDELRARAAGYIQMEEQAEFCNTIRDGLTIKAESSNREKQKNHFDQRSKRPCQARGPRYDFYTPLNAPRVNILEEANHADLISLPPPAYNSANADKSKHCRYHRNHGHTTEECWSLKDKIEELIQAGHLGQYIQRGQASHGRGRGRGRYSNRYQGRYQGHQGRSEQGNYQQAPTREENKPSANNADPQHGDKPSAENNLRGIINTIAGGFVGGGSSNSARKRHLRNVHNINDYHNSDSKMIPSNPPIVFTDDHYEGISLNQDDPMVISVEVANWEVQKSLIDQGSSADVLYWPTFLKLDIPHNMIQPYSEPNLLLGSQLGAIVSTPHLTMKFSGTDGHIITVRANQQVARRCYAESLKIASSNLQPEKSTSTIVAHLGTKETADLDPRVDMHDRRPDPIDELIEFQIGKKPNQCTRIGKHVETHVQGKIMSILIGNADLFAWNSADMPGIDPNFICHRLAIHREAKPVSQKQRKIGGERR